MLPCLCAASHLTFRAMVYGVRPSRRHRGACSSNFTGRRPRRRRLEAGDVAPPPAPAAPVAKSIKCVATGELFPTMAAAQAYAAQTGRTDFEESTEECVPEPPPEDPEDDEMYT